MRSTKRELDTLRVQNYCKNISFIYFFGLHCWDINNTNIFSFNISRQNCKKNRTRIRPRYKCLSLISMTKWVSRKLRTGWRMADGGWKNADDEMRMEKCGWKADGKMRMTKSRWKITNDNIPIREMNLPCFLAVLLVNNPGNRIQKQRKWFFKKEGIFSR